MNRNSIHLLLLLAAFLGFQSHSHAQSHRKTISFKPVWQGEVAIGDEKDPFSGPKAAYFEGALMDETIPNLPYKDILVELQSNETVQLSNVEAHSVSQKQNAELIPTSKSAKPGPDGHYPAAHALLGQREIRAGRHFQHIRIYPIRLVPGNGAILQAEEISFSYQIQSNPHPANARSNKTYASESVLSKGVWLKLGTAGEGIYKVSRSDISGAGIDPDAIDPRTFRLYGNGGGMLSQEAGLHPYDDLVENPVWVSGESDGKFDTGDFVAFYAASAHSWTYNTTLARWTHQKNVYSDSCFYFLTYGQGQGKRIATAPDPGPATSTPSHAEQYFFRESDNYNPLGSGRYWLGETFDLTTNREFMLPISGMKSGTELKLTVRVGARSQVSSSMTVRESGSTLGTMGIGALSFEGYGNYYNASWRTFSLPASSLGDQSLDLAFSYNKPLTSSVAYLDYIEGEYVQKLDLLGRNRWFFSAHEGTGPGQVFQYELSGASSSTLVWDLSDPVRPMALNGNLGGGKYAFRVAADSTKRIVAFNENGISPISSIRRQNGQNLHGLGPAEYLIVSPTGFFPAANRLAQFHEQEFGRTVHIASPQQIYNEFSSGRPDPTAIRDYIKMFYDRWLVEGGLQPQYVLFLGDGSYDMRGISEDKSMNKVPTYEARNSQHAMSSFTSDDFFGFLDDGEGFWGENTAASGSASDPLYYVAGDSTRDVHGLDVAVGRIPVQTLDEANAMIDKIIGYRNDPSALGAWRNKILLAADHHDPDGSLHVRQADGYSSAIAAANPCINIDKVYMDNYIQVPTASGQSFPEGREQLFQSLNEGALIANYTGHGGETGWSNSSILTISDINKLENGFRLPAVMTATCEFGRWDDPGRRSGGEQLLLNPNGGAIAMFTTVRVVEAFSNKVLNENFYKEVLKWDSLGNRWPTMGEVFLRTKNRSWLGGAVNNRNFSLLGDPGLPLAYPEERAVVTRINGHAVQQGITDSLASLSRVTIEGEIRDAGGNFLPNFNGELSLLVFDKPNRFTTRRAPINFLWRKSRVFNSKATVQNGHFSFQFVVPLDVSYEEGSGKISLYVQNGQTDGAGCHQDFFMGGTDSSSVTDNEAPELLIYMNDEKFVDGGMVGPNPMLIAELYDENGINSAGTGIGHDLTAILDGNAQEVVVLNDFYEAYKDNYQEGEIRFPFESLAEGEHSLKVRVWDVANNSAESELTFLVADDAEMALGHVLNYPNPFTTSTKFYLEHNLNGHALNVSVKIFTVSGRLVKTLEDSFYADGNLYCDLEWDGLDEYGDAIGRGVYVYQVSMRDEVSGERVDRFEKLVLLR